MTTPKSSTSSSSFPTLISRLTADDLPDLLAISQAEKWSHTLTDWKVMMATGKSYGHRQQHNNQQQQQLVSCVHITEYGSTLASLGMLIVSKSARKKGLATSLLHHVMATHKQAPIALVTSGSKARTFYPPFGFQPTGEHIMKYTREQAAAVDGGNRNVETNRFPSTTRQLQPIGTREHVNHILELDNLVTQLDRGHLLRSLIENSAHAYYMTEEKAERKSMMGYGLAKLQGNTLLVGPVVAKDDDSAFALCSRLIDHHHKGRPTRIDIFESQPELGRQLENIGFQLQDKQPVMMLLPPQHEAANNTPTLPGNRSVIRCAASQAWV